MPRVRNSRGAAAACQPGAGVWILGASERFKPLDVAPSIRLSSIATCATSGEVFTVDGRILAVRLTTLTDNESFFPEFNAAVSIRKEAFERDSDIAGVLNPVAAKLTGERHARC